MESFTTLESLVVPLDRANVDTDALLPKQFMKSIRRTGFGGNLFDEWRYLDRGEPGQDVALRPRNPDFPLNRTRYSGARILLARENFGCGSSREHAPWALLDYGIRVVIAPSFADIFFSNCFKNSLLPIQLAPEHVDRLFKEATAAPGYRILVDLHDQGIRLPSGETIGFSIDKFRKHCMLNGLDEIGLTLEHRGEIAVFEAKRFVARPWLDPVVRRR